MHILPNEIAHLFVLNIYLLHLSTLSVIHDVLILRFTRRQNLKLRGEWCSDLTPRGISRYTLDLIPQNSVPSF